MSAAEVGLGVTLGTVYALITDRYTFPHFAPPPKEKKTLKCVMLLHRTQLSLFKCRIGSFLFTILTTVLQIVRKLNQIGSDPIR